MFDINKLIKTVKKLAKESPDNVYNGVYRQENPSQTCSYSRGFCSDGTEGCIFGQALRKLGISEDDLLSFDTLENFTIIGVLQRLQGAEYKGSDLTKWCQLVQSKQDCGESWLDAVNAIYYSK